jgi:hypothetical protein
MDFEVANEKTLAESQEVKDMNGLLYAMPQSLSSTVDKTYVRQQAQRQSYEVKGGNNPTMVFDLNTSNAYIDPENCYLTFEIWCNTNGPATEDDFVPLKQGIGGIALIQETHIHAKSGVELDRIQHVNQYSYTRSKIKYDSDFFNSWAHQWGADETGTPYLGKIGDKSTPKRLAIPMKQISTLFEPTVKGMLMPASLASGARIELTLESIGRAFGEAVTLSQPDTYTINDPSIVCLQHTLTNNSERVLVEEASATGLEYTYNRVFTTSEPISQNTQNIQIKKAVSQGLRVFATSILTAKLDSITADSFNGDNDFKEVQFRVGSNFYPQQRIGASPVEQYQQVMNVYNKQPNAGTWGIAYTVDDYIGNVDLPKNVIQGVDLQSNARLNSSGQPINNSATLTMNSKTDQLSNSYTFFVFLEYLVVASSFLTNIDVKI